MRNGFRSILVLAISESLSSYCARSEGNYSIERVYQEWKGELIEGKIYFPTVSISIDFEIGREERRDDETERVYRARGEVGQ